MGHNQILFLSLRESSKNKFKLTKFFQFQSKYIEYWYESRIFYFFLTVSISNLGSTYSLVYLKTFEANLFFKYYDL